MRVRQTIFCDLEIMTSRSFCYGGIVLILLDLKWFVLPAMIAYFLSYPVSAVYVPFLFWPEFQRLSR